MYIYIFIFNFICTAPYQKYHIQTISPTPQLRHVIHRSDWLLPFVAWQPQEALSNTRNRRADPRASFIRQLLLCLFPPQPRRVLTRWLTSCLRERSLCYSLILAEKCCTSWTSGFGLRISPPTKLRKVASLAANPITTQMSPRGGNVQVALRQLPLCLANSYVPFFVFVLAIICLSNLFNTESHYLCVCLCVCVRT